MSLFNVAIRLLVGGFAFQAIGLYFGLPFLNYASFIIKLNFV